MWIVVQARLRRPVLRKANSCSAAQGIGIAQGRGRFAYLVDSQRLMCCMRAFCMQGGVWMSWSSGARGAAGWSLAQIVLCARYRCACSLLPGDASCSLRAHGSRCCSKAAKDTVALLRACRLPLKVLLADCMTCNMPTQVSPADRVSASVYVAQACLDLSTARKLLQACDACIACPARDSWPVVDRACT